MGVEREEGIKEKEGKKLLGQIWGGKDQEVWG